MTHVRIKDFWIFPKSLPFHPLQQIQGFLSFFAELFFNEQINTRVKIKDFWIILSFLQFLTFQQICIRFYDFWIIFTEIFFNQQIITPEFNQI